MREQIFKILFRMEFNSAEEMDEQVDLFFSSGDMQVSEKDRLEIIEKTRNIYERIPTLDQMIRDHLEGWTLERVGKVELAVLRLAVYELVYDPDIPAGVAISEAVELAGKFGDDSSNVFVNGVLSKFDEAKQAKK